MPPDSSCRFSHVFSSPSPWRHRLCRLSQSRPPESTPFFITAYLYAASKRKLTKHSRFIRMGPIKIIREARYQNRAKVQKRAQERGVLAHAKAVSSGQRLRPDAQF